MSLLLPYALNPFPVTEDLLLLLSCKDLFAKNDLTFINLEMDSTEELSESSLCILPGELANFTKCLSILASHPATKLLCVSVKITSEELKSLDLKTASYLKLLIENKQVTAYDENTANLLAESLGGEPPEVTGSLLFFNRSKKIPFSHPRPVFFADSRYTVGENAIHYSKVSEKEHTLFITNNFTDLEAGAVPGITTFVSPLFPNQYAEAIVSASHLFSNSAAALLFAMTHSIPCTKISDGAENQLLQEIYSSGAEEKQTKIDSYRKKAISFLKHSKIPVAQKADLKSVGMTSAVLASISDSNYYPFLRGWILNCLQFVTNPIFHILALDEEVVQYIQEDFPNLNISAHLLKDLWSQDELPEILTRSIGVRAFSSKPRLIKKAIEVHGLPVVYADSDVYFFANPLELVDELGESNVLLFPHWNEHKRESRHDGLFNAGMLTVSTKAMDFLNWWSEACFDDCRIASEEGVSGDQGYLDFAPVYFEGVKSYSQGDHNVARWNIKSLGAARRQAPDWNPIIENGSLVKSFHAAFIDGLGLFECKAAWDQICNFYSRRIDKIKSKHFVTVSLAQQSRHWVGLSRALRVVRLVTRKQSISAESKLRNFLMTGIGKTLIQFVFQWRNKEPLCESALTPPSLEADTSWSRFQKKRFLGNKKARVFNSRSSFKSSRLKSS